MTSTVRRGGLVVACLLACACLVSGCVTSQAAFDRLQGEVSERNARREREAWSALLARGYTRGPEEVLRVSLPDGAALARCGDLGRLPADAFEPVMMRVGREAGPGQSGEALMQLRVDGREACLFLGRQAQGLDGVGPDEAPVRLFRVGEDAPLVRDGDGGLVVVDVSYREVARRHVLVEERCDHMPSPPPYPFGPDVSIRAVAAAEAPPHVELVIEREVLDVECTENTY